MSPRAIIETSMGMITAELFADGAPGTVENFVKLANAGFYKNMIFHRIIKSFVIQTGDPTGTGRGGSDKQIKLETNTSLLHEAGALGMARGNERNSASSQFYICDSSVHGLDNNYAVFGKVTEGMDVVHAIASVPTGSGDRPVDPPKLLSVSIQ
jgi:peptidyl-prolyl cis-trans isomerase B (cyclophilin B)